MPCTEGVAELTMVLHRSVSLEGLRPPRRPGHAALAAACWSRVPHASAGWSAARLPSVNVTSNVKDASRMPSSTFPALLAAYMRAAAGRRPGSRVGPFAVGLAAHSD